MTKPSVRLTGKRLTQQFTGMVIATVLATPDDRLGRLALADWIEEHYLTNSSIRRKVWLLRESHVRECVVRVAVRRSYLGGRYRLIGVDLVFARAIPKGEIPFDGPSDVGGLPLMNAHVVVEDLPQPARDALVAHEVTQAALYNWVKGAWVHPQPVDPEE
jgi:hypothetical protein